MIRLDHRWTGLLLAVLVSAPALANADLEARIAALERQLEALKLEVQRSKGDGLSSEAIDAGLAAKSAAEAPSTTLRLADTRFDYGGYVQLDAIASQFSDGEPGTLMNDIFVPADIPVAPRGAPGDAWRGTNFHAKTSRFHFATQTSTDFGLLSSNIELDFIASAQGDERVTNSFASRIRLAYLSWDYAPGRQLLAGQDWSTFVNTAALPDLLDLVGPVGVAFDRQALLRWTAGPFQFSLENETSVLSGDDGQRRIDDDQLLPDLVARYNATHGDLHWSVAGMARRLHYSDRRNGFDEVAEDSQLGFALSLAGKWYLGRDDLRFMLNYGDGLGRYMGLNAFNDGFVDSEGRLQALAQYGGYAAYRHYWSDRWRSNVSLSFAEADNPGRADYARAEDLAEAYRSLHLNLNYLPAPDLQLGGELILGEKRLEDGRRGDMLRLQFAAKYAF